MLQITNTLLTFPHPYPLLFFNDFDFFKRLCHIHCQRWLSLFAVLLLGHMRKINVHICSVRVSLYFMWNSIYLWIKHIDSKRKENKKKKVSLPVRSSDYWELVVAFGLSSYVFTCEPNYWGLIIIFVSLHYSPQIFFLSLNLSSQEYDLTHQNSN